MNSLSYCEEKAVREGSSLYYSIRVLPSAKRNAVVALHALWRELQEISYECHDPQVARAKLQWWQGEIAELFTGNPRHPVCVELSKAIEATTLDVRCIEKILHGIDHNLDQGEYANFAELESFCELTGGTLSQLCTQVMGYKDVNSLTYANTLGIAMQLLGILRNVRRDALVGRIYLPQDELKQFQISPQDFYEARFNERVQAIFAYQATRIRKYYSKALTQLPLNDYDTQRAGRIRIQLSLATLHELETDGYQLFKHAVRVTPLRKLWISLRTR
jgi:phytoene synthase